MADQRYLESQPSSLAYVFLRSCITVATAASYYYFQVVAPRMPVVALRTMEEHEERRVGLAAAVVR